jgi:hypothetical protein
VLATIPGALEKEIDRVEPHLFVCELPVPENPGGKVTAWIELSIDPNRPSRFRVGQRRGKLLDPGTSELMTVVTDS